jgi:hypothetical protein
MKSLRMKCLGWSGFSLALLFVACLNDAPDALDPVSENPALDTSGEASSPPDTLPAGWRASASAAAGGDSILAAVRGDSGFAAIGAKGTIVFSRDGAAWTQAETPADQNLHAVASQDGRYVAVGDSGTLLVTGDGLHWTQADTLRRAIVWRGLVIRDSVWMALGYSSRYEDHYGTHQVTFHTLTSTDQGRTWTARVAEGIQEIHASSRTGPYGAEITFMGAFYWDAVRSLYVLERLQGASQSGRWVSPDGLKWLYEL